MGHTRSVFDILGDVVNVSSTMNSFSLPGYIQISEATYNCIKYLDFNFRERGEIMIKGKGNMKTYLVSMPVKIEISLFYFCICFFCKYPINDVFSFTTCFFPTILS